MNNSQANYIKREMDGNYMSIDDLTVGPQPEWKETGDKGGPSCLVIDGSFGMLGWGKEDG